jgi:PAS domain S-box-containing protein
LNFIPSAHISVVLLQAKSCVLSLPLGSIVQNKIELQRERGSVGTETAFENTELLANLISLSYEPMLAWRLDGAIKFWNAGAERLYGFAPDEAVGRNSHSLLQTKFPIGLTELRSRLWNERFWSGELRHTCKDGHEVIVDSRMQLIGDDTVLEVNRDITARKQSEIAGQQSEARLAEELARSQLLHSISVELILEQSIDALYQKLVDAAVIVMRSQCGSMQTFHADQGSGGELHLLAHLGFSPQAAKFWEWIGVESHSSCAAAMRTRQRVIVSDVEQYDDLVGTDDLVMFREAGIRATQTTPLLSRNGLLVGMISTHWTEPHQPSERDLRQLDILARQAADLIERSQTANALDEGEERLRALGSIVESSDDAIVSKNLDGIITSWNKGAERVFGYTPEEAIGQPITIVIPHDRFDEERMILTRIRRGERIDHFETIRQRKDGSLIVISLSISPVKNVAGKIIGASKIARDMTEQKRAQEQVAVLAREAEHRSRNMLATVQATVNLSQSDTAEGLKHAIEGRIQAIANVHSLFSESRWIGAELSAIATRELAPYFKKNEARVRIDGPPVLLKPDVAQAIAVIVHELGTNAAKYGALSTIAGQVELKWSHAADGWVVLRWTEMGGPPVTKPTRRGFGSRVIESMSSQLKGKTCFDWRGEGLACVITLKA